MSLVDNKEFLLIMQDVKFMRKHLRTMRCYIKLISKKYYKFFPELIFFNAILIGIVCLLSLLLVFYTPPAEWQCTEFTIEKTAYRYSKGGGVLNIHTTDGRDFNINEKDEILKTGLKAG